jgi:type I restriction enzyme M protein
MKSACAAMIEIQGELLLMFEQAFKNIDDVLRKEAGCTTELDYTEQTSRLLFLKYLDALEQDKAMEAELKGKKSTCILDCRDTLC